MATAATATPQRPLPGGFVNTPAPVPAPTIFAPQAASLRQHPQPPVTDNGSAQSGNAPGLSSIERAAKTINATLAAEARFPELESYIGQGMSGDYDLPSNAAWEPFQKVKMYDLPPPVVAQSNQSTSALHMGVFPALAHCWVIIDNCLYLWDYTVPNAELIGFEEQPNPITHVQLTTPKPGIFVKDITHLIVVATTHQMMLLGVAATATSTGAKSVSLYNTRMTIPTSGLNVGQIRGSKKTGRIFFIESQTEDIYEFQYQQDEGWFRGKCARICHTRSQYDFTPIKTITSIFHKPSKMNALEQLVIDDTRDLMYTLSDADEIKIWSIKDQIRLVLARPLSSLLQNTGHFTGKTDLLYGPNVHIRSISAIPATEAAKLSLMATTNTGCRLYLSATRGYGIQADAQNPPSSMQILHITFPPKDPSAPSTIPLQSGQTAMATYGGTIGNVDTQSRMLDGLRGATRIPPGYFLAFQDDLGGSTRKDKVFCSATDFARLKNPQDTTAPSARYAEFGQWLTLPAEATTALLITPDFAASDTTTGFGNELAVQFDQTSAEIAIMTHSGVQTIRRRRLVDVFATMMRTSSTDEEGREGDIKRFIRTYGRGETAATALAVACGQGLDVPQDNAGRLNSVTDPDVLEGARKAFIEQGGKPEYNANAILDRTADPIDSVRPSPRHEGLALYISRLVRSIWPAKIITELAKPGEPPKLISTVRLEKLRDVQKDLNTLSDFLERNKSFIEGLAGPQALSRVGNRQEEIALQGEHRAMNSLVQLISSIVEGIAFALVLFDERIEEILAALSEDSRKKAKELRFEDLFVSPSGRDLAKELVKAIVNRNIANGSNVDTVAEALRRRCGSFCSADDVVIFKAQEQVKRASVAGSQSEAGRVLLNESERLFTKVAGSLRDEVLHWAVSQYVEMAFYAGAIQLCLSVANERDRAKRALAWIKDGCPDRDERKEAHEMRQRCYDLVFATIEALDQATAQLAEDYDNGPFSLAAKRRNEAYDVINASDDAVFQASLYDWYIANGLAERLLDIDTSNVVDYLKRKAEIDRVHADLLWRYYSHHNNYLQAAATQLSLAKSYFDLSLAERIEYLSRARTNASTRQSVLFNTRQSKQQLLREISDLLDIANIQSDLLQKFKADPRLQGEKRDEVLYLLEHDGILPIGDLFNQYSDQAEYYDINLMIYQVSDHRNPLDIRTTWELLVSSTHDRALAEGTIPWERVGEKVREMGRKLGCADATFPIQLLLPAMEKYALQPQEYPIPQTWAVDLFLELDIAYETMLPVLEQIYYGNEQPFVGSKRKVIAGHMVYVMKQWVEESNRRGEKFLCGTEENASVVSDCLTSLLKGKDLDADRRRQAEMILAILQRG
ncbi:hypothetical protein M433DRAFT_155581 [Acidomyces richmondensis BFW]|nr:MAG: hypothetical protein FE78DRAFT_91320 [Acidomyces sp. 'richmondensis']KYG44482.1 hypothetical protein M433DRAFT_155581 [Acidomyces richmondensis BFW]